MRPRQEWSTGSTLSCWKLYTFPPLRLQNYVLAWRGCHLVSVDQDCMKAWKSAYSLYSPGAYYRSTLPVHKPMQS